MAHSAYFEGQFSSDEIREMFCERCDSEGKYAPADGLCVTCANYMCKVCIKYHCQYKSDHDILTKNEMPTDVCFDKCSDHTSKFVKFYCECCSSFACSDCRRAALESDKNEGHRWKHLPMLLVDFDNSNVHKDFEQSLCEVKQKLDIMHKNADRRKILNDQCYELATKKLRQKIEKYNESLSAIKRGFQDRFRREKSHNEENNRAITQDDEIFNTEISAIENDVSEMRKLGQKAKLFIFEVQYNQKLIEINCKLDKVKSESEIDTYKFEPTNVELVSENIGAFSVVPNKKTVNIQAKRVASIKTGFKWLLIPSGVQGICLVKSMFLVVFSCHCKTIKVFEVETPVHKELFSYVLPEEPCSLTTLNDDQIAVSLRSKKKGWIYIFSVSDKGTLTKVAEIYTQSCCRGLAKCANGLVVVHEQPISSVSILLPTGKIIETIEKDTEGNALFENPEGVALTHDNNKMYVSDFWKHAIVMRSSNGFKTYTDDELENPRGLTLDDDGLIYVCGQNSNNIHILTSDLQKTAVIPNLEEPISVLYDSKEKCLYIGFKNPSTISVLQVEELVKL